MDTPATRLAAVAGGGGGLRFGRLDAPLERNRAAAYTPLKPTLVDGAASYEVSTQSREVADCFGAVTWPLPAGTVVITARMNGIDVYVGRVCQ